MERYVFALSDDIMRLGGLSKPKEEGMFNFAIKEARLKYPNLYIKTIEHDFDVNRVKEENGRHQWIINLCTLEELRK